MDNRDASPGPDREGRETWHRAQELLARMTPAEKAGQLTQLFYFPQTAAKGEAAVRSGEAGALLFVADPAETNRLQRIAVEETRLGIPLLFGFDVIHGFRTIFPVPLAMAASWDPDIIKRAQSIAAKEARAVGIHWAFAPMVDIARDPRWGRMIEGAGEDPFLGSAVAAAHVRGFQGDDPADADRVISGPKHFAGYGAAMGGRDYDEANISDSELWNVYLPPFEAAVKAGCGNIMAAYMDLNGIPATGNRWLLSEVLRNTWDFQGFVVSDANSVRDLETHGFARNQEDAATRALWAGIDMEMVFMDPAYTTLPQSLGDGQISEGVLDTSVLRILETKINMGLFENPYVDESRSTEVLEASPHREVAREAAERSMVLLRNEGNVLPLDDAQLASIALIGPFADDPREIIGPWSFDFRNDETVTILDGIRHRAGNGIDVRYAPGIRRAHRVFPSMFDAFPGQEPDRQPDFDDDGEFRKAIDLATSSDVAVVVLGEWQNMIGEDASRASMTLPGRQTELLQAVVETGTPVVLLLMNGRPLDITWANDRVPAILDIWYPGSQGGHAVANILFGDVAPGGKLPFTWPRSMNQVPLISSHTRSHQPEKQGERYWDEPSTPLFPFGYGLSYSPFAYRNIRITPDTIHSGTTATVSVEVTNTGARTADDVAQMYIHQRFGSASRPIRELKGFQRVTLEAGERRTVTFTLGPDQLRYWNAAVRDWVIDEAEFDLWIGSDSTASLQTTFSTAR
ncbi:MAG TPA: beta-glucosidase BglX [Thermomicrobiales bacterium]|nr:beta-glucosidase BglX [Thermomicrobiales bacterium]